MGGLRDGNLKRGPSWISDEACPARVFFMRKIKFLNTCMPAPRTPEGPRGTKRSITGNVKCPGTGFRSDSAVIQATSRDASRHVPVTQELHRALSSWQKGDSNVGLNPANTKTWAYMGWGLQQVLKGQLAPQVFPNYLSPAERLQRRLNWFIKWKTVDCCGQVFNSILF